MFEAPDITTIGEGLDFIKTERDRYLRLGPAKHSLMTIDEFESRFKDAVVREQGSSLDQFGLLDTGLKLGAEAKQVTNEFHLWLHDDIELVK